MSFQISLAQQTRRAGQLFRAIIWGSGRERSGTPWPTDLDRTSLSVRANFYQFALRWAVEGSSHWRVSNGPCCYGEPCLGIGTVDAALGIFPSQLSACDRSDARSSRHRTCVSFGIQPARSFSSRAVAFCQVQENPHFGLSCERRWCWIFRLPGPGTDYVPRWIDWRNESSTGVLPWN